MSEHLTIHPAIIESHKKQRQRYHKLYNKFSSFPQKLHFASHYTQLSRFLQFLKIGPLDQHSILDLGCGLGDFFQFINEQGINTDYTGYEIVSGFVDHCLKTYPNAHFEEKNILLSKPSKTFDYVLASGIFAHGNRIFFEELLKLAFDLSDIAFGFNMFESKQEDFFQICEQEVLFLCRSLKPSRLDIIKNYLPHDYTIFLYK